MNSEQWFNTIAKAYNYSGIPFTDEIKQHLLAIAVKDEGENYPGGIEAFLKSEKCIVNYEAQEIIRKYFWVKAIKGETFGSLKKIKDIFGKTPEKHYGLNDGPFINLAKTYWTYAIELDDFSQNLTDPSQITYFYMSLVAIEDTIASVFFPTPSPEHVSVSMRREEQISVLKHYAPQIDIERFINESPILKAEELVESPSKSGCMGRIITFFLPISIIGLWYILT